jgi:hypothetical protein
MSTASAAPVARGKGKAFTFVTKDERLRKLIDQYREADRPEDRTPNAHRKKKDKPTHPPIDRD